MTNEELTEKDREEIAQLVQEGYDGGISGDEEGRHISWELKVTIWTD